MPRLFSCVAAVGARPLCGSESPVVETQVELRHLRYFVVVAEELHFARAAERLHISQSPLSRAIRDLERELGVVLFVRTTRRVEITPAGLLLFERARRALAEIDGAVADVQRMTRGSNGGLRLGYGPFNGAAAIALLRCYARAARHYTSSSNRS
jgi:DNA-binding transcriptional LysR family regulator